MAGYFIVDTKVKDRDVYTKYAEKVRPIVEKYKSRYLARK
ncbi:MAG: DUF1330 domain-containing protein [Candidatus Omnitrophica bacterium]|nr:DUF1330 domain-containing protein [Candidatus Omnitrophota bacterium]